MSLFKDVCTNRSKGIYNYYYIYFPCLYYIYVYLYIVKYTMYFVTNKQLNWIEKTKLFFGIFFTFEVCYSERSSFTNILQNCKEKPKIKYVTFIEIYSTILMIFSSLLEWLGGPKNTSKNWSNQMTTSLMVRTMSLKIRHDLDI